MFMERTYMYIIISFHVDMSKTGLSWSWREKTVLVLGFFERPKIPDCVGMVQKKLCWPQA